MSNSITYCHNEYEFDVVKKDDNVTITCLDKSLHKSYQESFTEHYVNETLSVGNLYNFFEIICHCFNNKNFTVIMNCDSININIYYSNILKHTFSLILQIIEQQQLSANSLYIKKLENRLTFLENHIESLENELKYNTFVCIGTYNHQTYNSIIVPLYFDMLNITKDNGNIKKLSTKFYYVYDCSYDYTNKQLNIVLGSDQRGCSISLNIFFVTLKPKHIIFSDEIKTQLTEEDMKFFPKENN